VADDEARRFEEIVAHLRDPPPDRPARRRRVLFVTGVICCLAAIAIMIFGGVEGTVLAVFPWLLGMILVVTGRPRA
jgi:hypothetical protein